MPQARLDFALVNRGLLVLLCLICSCKVLLTSGFVLPDGDTIANHSKNISIEYSLALETPQDENEWSSSGHTLTKRSEQAQLLCSEELDKGPEPVRPPFYSGGEKREEWRWKWAHCLPGQAGFSVRCQQSHRKGIAIRTAVAPTADLKGRCLFPNYRCNEFEMVNFFGERHTTARCVDNARSREYIGPLYDKLQTCSYSANFYRGPGTQRTKVEVVNQAVIPGTDTGYNVKSLWFEDHTLGLPGERLAEQHDVSFVDYVFYITTAVVAIAFCAEVYPYPRGHPPNVVFFGAGVVGNPPPIPPKAITVEPLPLQNITGIIVD